MKINWKIRLLSKKFWLTLVPAVLIFVQTVATPFGYNWDFANLGAELTGIINATFTILAIVGVVVDPTTKGVNDSSKALSYDTVKDTEPEEIEPQDGTELVNSLENQPVIGQRIIPDNLGEDIEDDD